MSCRLRRPLLLLTSLLAPLLLLAPAALAQKLPAPTEEHALILREAGVWDAKVKFWPFPGSPVEESTAKETCTALGGFWLLSRFEGEFAGMPFTGVGQTGYDPETGEYLSTWIDSVTPAILTSRGEHDPETGATVLLGQGKDWMTGKDKKMKLVTRLIGDDRKHFEMHEMLEGETEWRQVMEIDYTRAE